MTIRDYIALSGCGLVVTGLWWWSPPAAVITAGVLLITGAGLTAWADHV